MNHDQADADGSRRPARFLSLAWLITLVVLVALGWGAYDSYRRIEVTARQSLRIQELRGQIIYLDEVLTMSARMAVATGDAGWESRYRRYEFQLEAAIAEAKTLVPGARGSGQTDEANAALIGLENRAFDLLRRDRLEAAQGILSGEEYAAQKAIYAEGMQALGRQLEAAVASALHDQRTRTVRQLLGGAAAISLLLVGWVVVLRIVHQWRRDLAAEHRLLLDELAAANDKTRGDLEAAAKVQQAPLPRTAPMEFPP